MMRACKVLKGGLQDIADDLGVCISVSYLNQSFSPRSQVQRVGISHQAGSDSLLTSSAFFKMVETFFQDGFDESEYNGKLYGLGKTFTVMNGSLSLADSGRPGAATLAEREDRNPSREMQASASQTPSVAMAMAMPTIPSQIAPTAYGPMGANGPPYLRTSLGGR